MSQGFDPLTPKVLDPLLSDPVRADLNALASHHSGTQAPGAPREGWIWFDTSDPLNLKLKIFLLGSFVTILENLAAGPPTQSGVTKFTHTQGVAATTWTVNHTLNTQDLAWSVFDSGNVAIIPDTVTIVTPSQLQFTFLTAESGRAILVG